MIKNKKTLNKRFSNIVEFCIKYLILLVLSMIIVFTIFYMQKNVEIKNYREKIEISEKTIITTQKEFITTLIDDISADLSYLKEMQFFTAMLNSKDTTEFDRLKSDFTEEFKSFAKVNTNYDQLRYIDENGMEIIRINQVNNEISIVLEDELQDKSDRYYYSDAMKINEGDVYQSVLDLNVENGQIETPRKPMIRFAIKVYDNSHNEKGIIIINYNASNLLAYFDSIGDTSTSLNYMLNMDSYVLTGEDNMEFAFMYDDLTNNNFANQNNEVWTKINNTQLEDKVIQFYSTNGLITVAKIILEQSDIQNIPWFALSIVENIDSPYASNKSEFTLILSEFIYMWQYFIIVSLFIGILTFFIIERKKYIASITKMAKIDGLTGIFSRSEGFNVIESSLDYAVANNIDYSVCFIDVNDLKFVNDKLGHEEGDNYLRETVSVLQSAFRDSDHLVRIGGDEFIIGLTGSEMVIEKNWNKVLSILSELNSKSERKYPISLSHGVASLFIDGDSKLEGLLAQADKRMYEEKQRIKSGKNYNRTINNIY